MADRIIDLTLPIHEGMQTFPAHWHPMVEISQLGRFGVEDRETRRLVLGTHTGTHIDAPRHFIRGGNTVDQISLSQLVGMASIIDLSSAGPFREIGPNDLDARLGARPAERIMLRYDWSDKAGAQAYYTDHPFLSDEAARWLAARNCRLLAMDTPMPDNPKNGSGSGNDSPVHKIMLGSGAVLVEYLSNLRHIHQPEVFLCAAPLLIRGGDGAPARCFAIERE